MEPIEQGSIMNPVDKQPPDTHKSQEPAESTFLPPLDEGWLATMMRNMKRMAVDESYRQQIARQLS